MKANVYFYEVDGVEHFHFTGPVTTPSTKLVVDTKASEMHRRGYPNEYKAFLAAKEAEKLRVEEVMIEASKEKPIEQVTAP